MKRTVVMPLFVILLCLLSAATAFARDVKIINGTGFVITRLGLSAVESSTAEDLLGDDVLGDGDHIIISIEGDTAGWDLIAVDKQDNQVIWQNLNLGTVDDITLRGDGTAEIRQSISHLKGSADRK